MASRDASTCLGATQLSVRLVPVQDSFGSSRRIIGHCTIKVDICETHLHSLLTTNITPELKKVIFMTWDLGQEPCERIVCFELNISVAGVSAQKHTNRQILQKTAIYTTAQ